MNVFISLLKNSTEITFEMNCLFLCAQSSVAVCCFGWDWVQVAQQPCQTNQGMQCSLYRAVVSKVIYLLNISKHITIWGKTENKSTKNLKLKPPAAVHICLILVNNSAVQVSLFQLFKNPNNLLKRTNISCCHDKRGLGDKSKIGRKQDTS